MTAQPTAARGPIDRAVVLIPTYNERENLPLIVERVRSSVPEVDILVLDDNSPDGTGEVADELAAADHKIQVLHRQGKEGLGKAYVAGFKWALEHGYDAAIEMDADGSHMPEQLPAMLEAAKDADLVIGSRYVKGGSIVNWPLQRKVMSMGGNFYIKLALGMKPNDVTAGYRVYRRAVLAALPLDDIESYGYCFQTDLTIRTVDLGFTVVEVPITFVEREIGDSKMSGDIAKESLIRITKWGAAKRAAQAKALAGTATAVTKDVAKDTAERRKARKAEERAMREAAPLVDAQPAPKDAKAKAKNVAGKVATEAKATAVEVAEAVKARRAAAKGRTTDAAATADTWNDAPLTDEDPWRKPGL